MTARSRSAPASWSLAIVIGSVAVIGINNGMLTPLIALRAEAAGVSTTWNGILAAAPSLAILLLGSTFPSTIRRLGVLQSFYYSTALAVISALLFPVFSNYWVWLLLKFAMGVSLGLQWVVSESWINSLAAGSRRGTILGIFVSVFSGGLALGPFALSFVGSEGYLPFAICAALLIVCGLPLPFAEKPQGDSDGAVPQSIMSTLRTAPAENFAAFINGASWGTQLSLLPLYAIHLGSEPGRALQLLTGMCVGSLVCQPVLGRLIDRFSPTHVLAVCGAAQLVICAVLAQSISSDLVIWPLVFAWGAAVGGMYTAGLSGLGSKFTAGDMPTASTGFTMIWEVGALCGPVIAGAAMQVWDPHGLAVVLAVLGTLLLLASLRFRRVVTAA
jgi:MFS family permease